MPSRLWIWFATDMFVAFCVACKAQTSMKVSKNPEEPWLRANQRQAASSLFALSSTHFQRSGTRCVDVMLPLNVTGCRNWNWQAGSRECRKGGKYHRSVVGGSLLCMWKSMQFPFKQIGVGAIDWVWQQLLSGAIAHQFLSIGSAQLCHPDLQSWSMPTKSPLGGVWILISNDAIFSSFIHIYYFLQHTEEEENHY